ncbi:MAG: poxA [Gammaproteobacteria bacterium]|nr:poxA [Gammaproteobacteria bacterium]
MQTKILSPTSKLANLKKRAQIIADIRAFFAEREVLEVETPLLGRSTATDPHIASFAVPWLGTSGAQNVRYLQTSPEFPMKRLLSAGIGSIYQITKVFRSDEQGRWHHPEFTMLEWYRVGFNHYDLMREVDLLLQRILKTPQAERATYAELFERYLSINPHLSSIQALQACAKKNKLTLSSDKHENRDFWLNLLMSHCIEPHLGETRPILVMDFPASQAALAKVRDDLPPVAERFEAYYKGIELLNGYHELTDAEEHKRRFLGDNQKRKKMGLPEIPLDEAFLQTIENMPDCAGVALGVDRLVMLALGANLLADVMSFADV